MLRVLPRTFKPLLQQIRLLQVAKVDSRVLIRSQLSRESVVTQVASSTFICCKTGLNVGGNGPTI